MCSLSTYKINFSCFTSVNKSLHLLCAHFLVIANYDLEKRTLVVMLTQMQHCRGEFYHIKVGEGELYILLLFAA